MKQTIMTFINEGQYKVCGIVDSLRGMVSLFHFCKKLNIKFEIKFTYPFSILTYLKPNKYNWIPTADNTTENIRHSVVDILCQGEYGEVIKHRTTLYKLAATHSGQHIYIFTNTVCFDDNFSQDFKELFDPTPHLRNLIESNLQLLPPAYNSVSCRTCGIFGDFPDILSPLSLENQQELIDKYKKTVGKLAAESYSEKKKLLLTSDSRKLISELSGLQNIVVIPGPIVHSRNSLNKEGIDKVFTEFFLISGANKAYSITSKGLFKGAYSYYASKLGNIEYITINLSDSEYE